MQSKCWHYAVPNEKGMLEIGLRLSDGPELIFWQRDGRETQSGATLAETWPETLTHSHTNTHRRSCFSTLMVFTRLAFPTRCEGQWPFLPLKSTDHASSCLSCWLIGTRNPPHGSYERHKHRKVVINMTDIKCLKRVMRTVLSVSLCMSTKKRTISYNIVLEWFNVNHHKYQLHTTKCNLSF